MTKLDDYYVVTAMKGNKRVYIDYDSHSGGYPYWREYGPQKKHKTALDAIKEFNSNINGTGVSYMQREVTDAMVAKVSTTLTKVDIESDEVVAQIRQMALDKLSEEEKAVLGLK